MPSSLSRLPLWWRWGAGLLAALALLVSLPFLDTYLSELPRARALNASVDAALKDAPGLVVTRRDPAAAGWFHCCGYGGPSSRVIASHQDEPALALPVLVGSWEEAGWVTSQYGEVPGAPVDLSGGSAVFRLTRAGQVVDVTLYPDPDPVQVQVGRDPARLGPARTAVALTAR